ncbi:MAG: insulinase family protein [Desulfobacterales bacterium]|nr:insulinase family protein [Desulfobacterales bacterium]
MANSEPADRVSMHLDVQTGSLYEREDQRGAAHFLEHMQFNGSEHFPPGELVKYFQRIGMQFGPDANARTGFFDTVYDILLPDGSTKSIREGLQVLKDYAAGSLLLESEVDRERRVILAEKRSRDSASYRTFEAALAFELAGALPPSRLPIGTESAIKQMDRALLKDFYDTWYRPDTMILVMVGDFEVETARSLAESFFSDLHPRKPLRPEMDFGRFSHRGVNVLYHPEDEAGKTSISIETLVQVAPEPDSSTVQSERLVKEVADRMVQNRLDVLIRKPHAPFTSAHIGSGRFLKRVESAEIGADCSPEKWEQALTQLEQTLRQALDFGFTAEELERVKMDFMSELDDAVKKAPTRKSQTLARQIIRNLNDGRVFRSPQQEKSFFGPLLETLTLDQVNAAFVKTWPADHRLILVSGNARLEGSAAEAEKHIAAVYSKSSAVAVDKPVQVDAMAFPYLPQPEKPGVVTDRKRIDDLDIVQVTYANGNRLNLKKTDFKVGEVRFNLVFGKGRSSQPPGLSGLADIAQDLVNESGLGAMDRDQLQRALAGKTTQIRFDVEEGRFVFGGRSVPEELPLMFQLIDAHLRDPGYRRPSFDLCMERYRQRFESMSKTVRGAMTLYGNRFLAGGDNRFGLPPYEEFRRLTIDQVRGWLDPALEKAPLELSIVGDFNLSEAERLGALYLGTLSQRSETETTSSPRVVRFPQAESLRLPVTTRIPKGLVAVSYPTGDMWDIHRTRRLAVLADIVSDRLRENIREELGAAYSPVAFHRPSRAYDGYGLFQVFVQVAPEEAPLVEDQIKKISADIVANGITVDELRRAIDPALVSIKDLKRQNRYWLNTVLSGSREHPEQIQWCRSILKDYASIDIKDLMPLARRYLTEERSATIVVTPASDLTAPEVPAG